MRVRFWAGDIEGFRWMVGGNGRFEKEGMAAMMTSKVEETKRNASVIIVDSVADE